MPPLPQTPTCQLHSKAIEDLQGSTGSLAGEISSIRSAFISEIGLSPDPLNSDHPQGTGLKGLLCQVLSKLDALDKRVDDLAHASSVPDINAPPSQSLIKKVSWYFLIAYLAAQQIPAMYATIKASTASPAPAISTVSK